MNASAGSAASTTSRTMRPRVFRVIAGARSPLRPERNFQVVDETRAPEAGRSNHDQVMVALRRRPQIGLAAHRNVVGLPAVTRELRHSLLVEALEVALPGDEPVAHLLQHAVEP